MSFRKHLDFGPTLLITCRPRKYEIHRDYVQELAGKGVKAEISIVED